MEKIYFEKDKKATFDEDHAQHVERVAQALNQLAEMLVARGNKHDAGKLVFPHSVMYKKMFDELKPVAFGTPEYKQVIAKPEYTQLTSEHQKQNSHHPEFYDDGVRGMSLIDVLEMVIDWYVSSTRSETAFIDGVNYNLERFKINGVAANWILNTVHRLIDLEK